MAQASEVPSSVVKTSEVVGVEVQNSQGDDLGTIEEIILDKITGNVRYVVLSFGGFLGMGDKLFALPWNSIAFNESRDAFILNVSKDKLTKAPGFDKNNWPNFSDKKWAKSIFEYYGSEPYWLKDDIEA